MRVETLCTGDELLTGLTADTNSVYFQRRLLERCGLTVQRNTVVPDVREEIVSALLECAARADVLLVSGGLGPTTDDFTAECAAKAAGVKLVQNEAVRAHLEERFKSRGFALTENNLRQTWVPEGAEVIINTAGSAPCFVLQLGKCSCVFVPGVPKEYRHLVDTVMIPRLEKGRTTVRRLRVLKTIGLPESHLDDRVLPLHARHPAITFGFRTHAPENHLKLLAEASDEATAQAALVAAEKDCREVLGAHVFAADDETMVTVIAQALLEKKQSAASAESCTGGLLAAQLSAVPGASAWFRGGAVPYLEATKLSVLGVDVTKLDGAVSEPTARALAENVRRVFGADYGVSTTGYAGPGGGDEHNPVGTVFIAVAGPDGKTVAERHRFAVSSPAPHRASLTHDRERVQSFGVGAALDLLRRTVTS